MKREIILRAEISDGDLAIFVPSGTVEIDIFAERGSASFDAVEIVSVRDLKSDSNTEVPPC